MEVIDLLVKIASGEEVPKKIRINGYIYEYQGDDYLFIDKNNDNHEYWLFSDSYTNKFQWLDVFLKTEVEIIEENNSISHLDDYAGFEVLTNEGKFDYLYEMITRIIDKLNEMENKQ